MPIARLYSCLLSQSMAKLGNMASSCKGVRVSPGEWDDLELKGSLS